MIILQEYLDFHRGFFDKKYPHQRYGQAFCNKFNINDPELFSCENQEEAITLSCKYVKSN